MAKFIRCDRCKTEVSVSKSIYDNYSDNHDLCFPCYDKFIAFLEGPEVPPDTSWVRTEPVGGKRWWQ